jgi:hypothetical protein
MLGRAATTLRFHAHVTDTSTEALVKTIDDRYGPRLRVLSEEVLAQRNRNWLHSNETECRERVQRKGIEPFQAEAET